MRDEYNALTRFADLDTQRHVTSRTYESFALEGRYRVLAQLGFTREKIQEEQIYLNPVSGYSKFHRQQFPGVELRVETATTTARHPSAAACQAAMSGERISPQYNSTMPAVG